MTYAGAYLAHEDDPTLFWQTAKAVLRGLIIAYVESYKKKVKTSYDKACSKLRTYTNFKLHPSPQNRDLWISSKREFELWLDRRESVYRFHLEVDLLRFGNKPGRLPANLSKGRRKTSHITGLKDVTGQVHTKPRDVNEIPLEKPISLPPSLWSIEIAFQLLQPAPLCYFSSVWMY